MIRFKATCIRKSEADTEIVCVQLCGYGTRSCRRAYVSDFAISHFLFPWIRDSEDESDLLDNADAGGSYLDLPATAWCMNTVLLS